MGQLKSRQIWLGLGGTVLFLALFFRQTDLREFLNAMRDADYRWAVLGVMLWFVAAWPRSLRWKLILHPLRPLPVVILYPVLVIGYMANNLLPARLGELVRAYILGERYALSKAAVLGTVVVERVADGLTLVALMAVAGAFIGLGSAVGLLAMAMAALFVVAFLILVVAMMKRDAAEKAIKALCQPLPTPWQGKVLQLADAFLDGLMALRSPWALVGVMATGGVAWALEATMYFVVGWGFGIQGGFATFLVLTGAANLAIAVPSSAGGVGPFEWASQQVMVGAGVARGVASAYAVALHGLLLVPVIVVGLVFLWLLQVPLRAMARQPAEVAK